MQLDFIWSHVSLPGLGKPHHTNISPLSSGYVPGSRVDQPHTGRGEVAEGCHLHPGQARQRDSSWYTEITAVFVLLGDPHSPVVHRSNLSSSAEPHAAAFTHSMPCIHQHKVPPCLLHYTSPWTAWRKLRHHCLTAHGMTQGP